MDIEPVRGLVMLVLWVIGLHGVWVFARALPEWKAGSFFSSAVVETPDGISFLELFIPSNIFSSLARDAIPAVVAFCVAVGVALASLPNKRVFIYQLEVLSHALTRVNHFIVQLTPIGVFAISAHAAGTMSLAEVERLQAYVVVYTAAVLLMTFVILPSLIASITPFRYREVLSISKASLITAFATGKLLVVLPLLSEEIKGLLAERGVESENSTAMVDVVVPTAYNFPAVGMLLTMSFVHFGAWLVGSCLVEWLFSLGGTGTAFLAGTLARDYPVILGGIVLYSAVLVLFHLSIDVARCLVAGSQDAVV